MTPESIPVPLTLLAQVREVRRLQRAWFGGDKSPETLNAARAAERSLDSALVAFDAPQRGLFGAT